MNNDKNLKLLQEISKMQEIPTANNINNSNKDKKSPQLPNNQYADAAWKYKLEHDIHNTNPNKIAHNAKNAYKQKRDIYISIGDINGIGLELIIRNHKIIEKYCNPIYCVSQELLQEAGEILNIPLPQMRLHSIDSKDISIQPGIATKESGEYSFKSFSAALELSIEHKSGLITMPINKYAWNLANIKYKGHTEYLRERFNKNAIMMLGCKEMFVALFTDHVALKEVPNMINKADLKAFLKDFYLSFLDNENLINDIHTYKDAKLDKGKLQGLKNIVKSQILNSKMIARLLKTNASTSSHDAKNPISCIESSKNRQVAVLGLNPHAGDNGIIGSEDSIIKESIDEINMELQQDIFTGPIAPDSAFIPQNREKYRIYIAMYHDVGLSVLKALYFYKSINVSLNLPILRVSPDHGTGFDIAYKKSSLLDSRSYLESVHFLVSSM